MSLFASGRARFWAVYAVAWLPYVGAYAASLFSSGEASGFEALHIALHNVWPPAAAGVAVLWLTYRRVWGRSRARPFLELAHHAVVAAAFLVVTVASTNAVLLVIWPEVFEAMSIGGILAWQALMNLMVYAILASVGGTLATSERLRYEQERARRAEALKTRVELEALRARLNPHFLFNTLHSVLALIRRDPEAAEEAMETFGDLLRYATRVERDTVDLVPLVEEWDFVGDYLHLEELRLGSRLRVSRTMEPGLERVPVPVFCLQPLVENAVRHGIAPQGDGGRLSVSAGRRGDEMVLTVSDDGCGASREAIERANGQGLRLVRQRLEALFGPGARLELAGGAAGRGFLATVVLPAVEADP